MWTGTAIFPACQGTAELQPCLGGLGAAILTSRKVSLDFDAPLPVEVDERYDSLPVAVEIVGHGIMCGIQEPFPVLESRQESLHPEINLQEAAGIMFRGRVQEREDGEVAFRIGCDDHVQAITMIEAVPGGIPADVTIRLGEVLATAALRDAFGIAAADAVSPFLGRGDDRRVVPGDGKGRRIDEAFDHRFHQEFLMVYLEKGSIRLVIKGESGRF